MPAWQLEVLGGGHLQHESDGLSLDRKTAALLCYLALEGPTPRSRLAGLLWPDSTEEAARANLRQLLRRLRTQVDAELVAGGDPLRLTSELSVDVADLEVAVFLSQDATVAQKRAELLKGYDYDDCPEFADWLFATRERFAELERDAYAAEAARLEQAGDYRAAVSWAERLLAADPVAETPYRLVMRLYYLSGDRAAALKVFERCKTMLRREFDLEPLAETRALAQEIGRSPAPHSAAPRRDIPLSVLRPPVLAGREREWALLEDAWKKGQHAFISGEAGVGKTRLALDFAAAKGNYHLSEGRPGDGPVPFATQARFLRQALKIPSAQVLEPWLRGELSRLVPELSEEPPAPLAEADRLRLFQAVADFLASLPPGTYVAEDLHFYDSASLEAFIYLLAQNASPPVVTTFRGAELAAPVAEQLRGLVAAGRAVLIELEPLDAAGVGQLLDGLELPEVVHLSQPLLRATGGNPLFITESLKTLFEAGDLDRPLALPPRVEALLGQRLERLSVPTLRLVQLLAIIQEFTLELAQGALGTDPLRLAELLAELEAAQMVRDGRFTHDLLRETVRRTTPKLIATLLHRRVAEWLEPTSADPALIAWHWEEAGKGERALPWLRRAAQRAVANLRFREAADFYLRLGRLEEARGQHADAFTALEGAADALRHFETGERLEQLLERLAGLAETPSEEARVWLAKARRAVALHFGDETADAARRGYARALEAGDGELQANLLDLLAGALYIQGQFDEALEILARLKALHERNATLPGVAKCETHEGVVLDQLSRHREALEHHRRAVDTFTRLGDTLHRIAAQHNLAVCQSALGRSRAALENQLGVQSLLADAGEAAQLMMSSRINLAARYLELDDYEKALASLREALALTPEDWTWAKASIYGELAAVHLRLGQLDEAARCVSAALRPDDQPAPQKGLAYLRQGQLLTCLGQSALGSLEQAEALLGAGGYVMRGRAYALGQVWLAKVAASPTPDSLALARQTLEAARRHDLNGLAVSAHTRAAQALLQLEATSARQHSDAAVELLENFETAELSKGEVLLTRYQSLLACKDKAAPAALEAARRWLEETAARLGTSNRSCFLTTVSVNRAILEAARQIA